MREIVGHVSLKGRVVHLVPMAMDHVDGLIAAAGEDRSSYGFTKVPEATVDSVTDYIASALAAHQLGSAIPFVSVESGTGRVLGSTRFMNIESWNNDHVINAVEIGATWLAASAQRTAVNTEAKLLMLTHAFETWKVRRVAFKTDVRNVRSRANIERVGATFEGVLRNHLPSSDGANSGARDTAMYSIIDTEWVAVKSRLLAKLH